MFRAEKSKKETNGEGHKEKLKLRRKHQYNPISESEYVPLFITSCAQKLNFPFKTYIA